jgi:hypothetical protein
MRRATVVIASLGLLLAAGCGETEHAEAPSPAAKTEARGQESPRQETEAPAAESVGGGEIPDGFPKSAVPLPAGGRLTASVVDGDGSERSFTLNVAVDDAERTARQYRSALEKAGFAIEGEYAAADEDGAIQSYQATRSDWHVSVISARGLAAGEDVLMLAVTPAASADAEHPSADAGDAEADE